MHCIRIAETSVRFRHGPLFAQEYQLLSYEVAQPQINITCKKQARSVPTEAFSEGGLLLYLGSVQRLYYSIKKPYILPRLLG